MPAAGLFPILLLLLPITILAQSPGLVVPEGHAEPVREFRFDTQRNCFISITTPGGYIVKGWNSRTGHLNYTLDDLQHASVSKDAKKIIALTNKNTCAIYDGAAGTLLTEIPGATYEIRSVTLSTSGKYILMIATNDTAWAMIWNATNAKLIRKISLGQAMDAGYVTGNQAAISPDEKQFCTSGWRENAVNVWDIQTGKKQYQLKMPGSSYELKYSNTGQYIQSRFISDDSLRIWQAKTGEMQCILPDENLLTRSGFFSPNDQYFVTQLSRKSSVDSLRIWDIGSGKHCYSFIRKENAGILYENPVFTPDSKYLVFLTGLAEYESEIRIIEPGSGRIHNLIRDSLRGISGELHGQFIQKFQISPDGKKILAFNITNCIRTWDIQTGKLLLDPDDPYKEFDNSSHLTAIQYSSDGNFYNKIFFDNTVKNYDARTGKLIREYFMGVKSSPVESMVFSPSNDRYFTQSANKLIIWNRQRGESYIEITVENQEKTARITSAAFSPDGRTILVTTNDGIARLWETARPKMLWATSQHKASVFSGSFSPDGRYIVVIGGDSTIRFYQSNDGKFLTQLAPDQAMPRAVSFSPDGQKLLVTYSTRRSFFPDLLNILEVGSWKLLASLIDTLGRFQNVQFSPDNEAVALSGSGSASIWDWNNRKLLSEYGSMLVKVNNFQYTPDEKHFIWSANDSVAVLRFPSGEWLRSVYFPSAASGIMKFDPRGEEFAITSNSQVDFYDAGNFSLKYNLLLFQHDNYMIRLPSGYYKCLPDAAKQVYYMNDKRQKISFEQLDVRYNRPDKVLEALGNKDSTLIKSYRKAWEKRINKLGIDTTQFRDGYSVPDCDFVNRDKIEYGQKAGKLTLRIKGMDSSYKLDRFNVWVNESPLFGQRGISIRRKNKNTLDTTITIQLCQGENRIETSIINVNGTESYRMPLQVNFTPAVKQKESLRFIGIGIDKFSNTQYNLQYSSKDIRDLAVNLKEKYKDEIWIDTLFNENVTAEKVRALKKKLLQTSVNDKVIISYSGHGLLSKDYDYYLSTWSVNFDRPEENGLPYDELENLLDSIPARKKLMLIDACHSGEVDKEDLVTLTATTDSLVKGLKPVAYKKEGQLGLKNSFELMQSLFVNVGKSTGATIISAAAGTQFALERNDLENGVFTYCILETMNKYPTLKISELKTIVGERVEKLTNGLQKPTSRNEMIAADWSLW